MKQLTENPSPECTFRGWQILCVVLSTAFPPSRDLHIYLASWISSRTDLETIGVMAEYCAGRLESIQKRGPRGKAPSLLEIQCALENPFNPGVFGITLEKVMQTQEHAYPQAKVPIILMFLTDAMLALDALKTRGIFRISGNPDQVIELRVRIERGHYSLNGLLGPDNSDVTVPASAFKLWLRELEEPLIPQGLYNQCIDAAAADSVNDCIDLVRELPFLHRRVVLFVISFLQMFCDPSALSHTQREFLQPWLQLLLLIDCFVRRQSLWIRSLSSLRPTFSPWHPSRCTLRGAMRTGSSASSRSCWSNLTALLLTRTTDLRTGEAPLASCRIGGEARARLSRTSVARCSSAVGWRRQSRAIRLMGLPLLATRAPRWATTGRYRLSTRAVAGRPLGPGADRLDSIPRGRSLSSMESRHPTRPTAQQTGKAGLAVLLHRSVRLLPPSVFFLTRRHHHHFTLFFYTISSIGLPSICTSIQSNMVIDVPHPRLA